MNATVTEIIGLAAAIVVLAGFSVAVIHGAGTAQVVTSFGNAFTNSLTAAEKG